MKKKPFSNIVHAYVLSFIIHLDIQYMLMSLNLFY